MRAAIVAMFTSALAAPALAAPPAPAPTPAAKSCVNIANIRDTRVVDNRTIDFTMSDGRVLRNNLPNTCAGLKINRTFGYATSQSQLCNVDIITVIVQGGGPNRGASCGLGQFTPVAVPDK